MRARIRKLNPNEELVSGADGVLRVVHHAPSWQGDFRDGQQVTVFDGAIIEAEYLPESAPRRRGNSCDRIVAVSIL